MLRFKRVAGEVEEKGERMKNLTRVSILESIDLSINRSRERERKGRIIPSNKNFTRLNLKKKKKL